MASAQDMELFIDGVTATADAVGAKLKSDKKINISFDEWNVWYQNAPTGERGKNRGPSPRASSKTCTRRWTRSSSGR